jgi:acyl-CoA thioester hydrolase
MNAQPTFSVTQRVRFAETDAMGIVHHANYFLWFEVARVECLRQLGYSYKRMESEGYGLPVTEVGCRFIHGAKFDDLLNITVLLARLQSRKLRLEYRITNADTGELIVTGFTEHLCWRNGMVATVPVELREKIQNVRSN